MKKATIGDILTVNQFSELNRFGKEIETTKQVKDLTVEELFEVGRLLYMEDSISKGITLMSAANEAIVKLCHEKDLPIF
jgi:hypothetical protein